MNRIDVKDVDKVFYEPDGSNLHILSNISLTIHEKELIVVKGPSGSGKTTLLNIITGLLRPTTGIVYFNGLDISRLSLKQLASYRLKFIGYLFQHWNLLPFLNAKENIAVPQRILGSLESDRNKNIKAISTSLGIFDRLNNRPDEMSGGQKQRVALARALINNPSFLLADEPTSNLDVRTRTAIVKVLKEKRKNGLGLIITTHDPFFEEIADRVYILEKAKLKISKMRISNN
ncbi:MAG: ABC transporter ATP-binding protein [Candidatus Hodarchaeota archaeon]